MTQTIDWHFLYKVDPAERWTAHFTLMVWKAFRQYIVPGSRVLEIGCGPASLVSRSVLELGCQGVASDIDAIALDYAVQLAKFASVNITCIRADGFGLPFRDSSFDTVLSSGVIEHFNAQETERMVSEHARVCKQGGRVIIAVPNLLNLPLTYHKLRTGTKFHAYPEKSYTIWSLAGY
ncbi:MAG: class I SAM-dependent methyltransferase [Anaerolineae bacterium]